MFKFIISYNVVTSYLSSSISRSGSNGSGSGSGSGRRSGSISSRRFCIFRRFLAVAIAAN